MPARISVSGCEHCDSIAFDRRKLRPTNLLLGLRSPVFGRSHGRLFVLSIRLLISGLAGIGSTRAISTAARARAAAAENVE